MYIYNGNISILSLGPVRRKRHYRQAILLHANLPVCSRRAFTFRYCVHVSRTYNAHVSARITIPWSPRTCTGIASHGTFLMMCSSAIVRRYHCEVVGSPFVVKQLKLVTPTTLDHSFVPSLFPSLTFLPFNFCFLFFSKRELIYLTLFHEVMIAR